MLEFDTSNVAAFLKEKLNDVNTEMVNYQYGTVISSQDGIVTVKGLSNAKYGELLEFENDAYGMTMDLSLDKVSACLLTKSDFVAPGSMVRATGRISDIGVSDDLLGRVVDPIGRPLDGKPLHVSEYRPTEFPAPAIMDRAAVNTPMETGILAIDSMIPIGRGQRELIIGDRQTGKTTIALSAMMNQKDSGVICIYCAIGQKASSVASLVHTLEENGTMEHTVVLAAPASNSATMQYLAPYSACAIAEYFMYKGKDVLIVYDDLSKHAVAYRAMSLLLKRPSGREAYPGDVFYLHSRLLERAAKLSLELGGGSITALPIVETMAGDISAYIPTNVISITDGQIYLESELFNAGIRPAVNVGLSVSRVGRSAQHHAMKAVSGSLRLEVAQYRDLAVFAQFGADVDESTKALLAKGANITEFLKQPKETIHPLSIQVSLLTLFTLPFMSKLKVSQVSKFEESLILYLQEHETMLMNEIDASKQLSLENSKELYRVIEAFALRWEG